MNYDIRKICNYINEVHSRYYVDTNGVIYTSMSNATNRIMINGERKNINKIRKNKLEYLNKTNKMIVELEDFKNYYLLYNGEILQRLKTIVKQNDYVEIHLVTINNNERKCYSLSRIVAQCFIGNVEGREIHHIDRNRKNNKINNLQIMTFEEHRGKINFKKNHN